MGFLFASRFFKCRSEIKRVVTATQRYCSSVVSGKKHVNGVDLHYKLIGRGKHVVLLFPGALGCSETNFGPQRESLSKERFTLVAWDPRGYGRSRPPARDHPPDFLERDVEDGVNLMKALGFDKYSLLGWSAGGSAALIAAAKNPDVIHQMVVLGAFAMMTKEDVIAHQQLRQHFMPVIMTDDLVAMYGKEELPRAWADHFEALDKYGERPQGSICMELLPLIRCPTLIVNGDQDKVCPVYKAEYLFKHIKGSRLHLFPGGAHTLHLTHPDGFNKLVEDFLD